jgi:hypothetical protein
VIITEFRALAEDGELSSSTNFPFSKCNRQSLRPFHLFCGRSKSTSDCSQGVGRAVSPVAGMVCPVTPLPTKIVLSTIVSMSTYLLDIQPPHANNDEVMQSNTASVIGENWLFQAITVHRLGQ